MKFLYKHVVLFYCRVSEDAETSGFSLAIWIRTKGKGCSKLTAMWVIS